MKAVIVSAQRCGGLFLAGCLSNHPDVHCPREEPFRRESIWQQKLDLDHAALLDFVMSEPYYEVAMCRLTYDQALHPALQGYLLPNQVRIIHLVRDVLPVVTSTLLAKREMVDGVARHVFDDSFADDEVLDVKPKTVVQRIKHLLRQRALFERDFEAMEKLVVRYEDMIDAGGGALSTQEGGRICAFLDIEHREMAARNRKMHRRPMESYYPNWPEVATAVRAAFPDRSFV